MFFGDPAPKSKDDQICAQSQRYINSSNLDAYCKKIKEAYVYVISPGAEEKDQEVVKRKGRKKVVVMTMTMTMKKGITSGGLLLVCAMVVAFAAVTEAKLSPANCMPECMSICPKDAGKSCQEKCMELCEMLKTVHEEGMSGNAGGPSASPHEHQHKNAKTAHPGKHVDEDGSAALATCKSTCMPTCSTLKMKRPGINCDNECQEYCIETIEYLNEVEAQAKSKH